MTTIRDGLQIRIVALDPPFRSDHGVLFGLQDRDEVAAPVLADRTTTFATHVDLVDPAGTAPDFRGEHVQGRKGDRFLYLSWGIAGPSEPFVMFARAKIKLAGIPLDLIELAADSDVELVCELRATNHKGEPASGTIRGDDLVWRATR